MSQLIVCVEALMMLTAGAVACVTSSDVSESHFQRSLAIVSAGGCGDGPSYTFTQISAATVQARNLLECTVSCSVSDACTDVFYKQGMCTLATDVRGCVPDDIRHFVKVRCQKIVTCKLAVNSFKNRCSRWCM